MSKNKEQIVSENGTIQGETTPMANSLANGAKNEGSANSLATSLVEGFVSRQFETNQGTEITETSVNGGSVAITRFATANTYGKTDTVDIKSRTLADYTNAILGISGIESHAVALKCYLLGKVDTLVDNSGTKLIAKLGFKNIGEYAFTMFGLAKSTANQYARIGRLFYNEKGEMNDNRLPYLSTSQIIPLLTYVGKNADGTDAENKESLDQIIDWFEPDNEDNSLLNGTMGASKLTKRIKLYLDGELTSKGYSAKKALTLPQEEVSTDTTNSSSIPSSSGEQAVSGGTPAETPGQQQSKIQEFSASLRHSLDIFRSPDFSDIKDNEYISLYEKAMNLFSQLNIVLNDMVLRETEIKSAN